MLKWYLIDDDLPALNTIRKIEKAGKQICLINYNDNYFATGARCPHAGADLSVGWCEKEQIICPYHRHAFDLKNGRGVEGQGNYISVYPLEKQKGKWCIGIKSSIFQRLFGK